MTITVRLSGSLNLPTRTRLAIKKEKMQKVKALKNEYDQRAKYAQVKRDGYRLRITRNPAGIVKCWTRKPKDWTVLIRELPQAQVLWTRLSVPCILHAEVWAEDVPATSIISLVKAASPQVRLSIFAVERALPDDATLTDAARWCDKQGLDFIPYFIRGTRDVGCLGQFTSLSDLPKPYGDIEGYVFKDYNDQAMGEGWQKYCPVKKINLVVTGWNPGTPGLQYDGQVGSLICADSTGRVCANTSGFDQATRKTLGDHTIGRVIEVAFKGVASKGMLRMPRFLRFRDDIDPNKVDCLETYDG